MELDVSVVGRGVEEINRGTYGAIRSFLIGRYGKLVLEEYWNGNACINAYFLGKCTDFNRDTFHNLASVTKTVTSVLVRIAVDRGEIGGVDEKVSVYFPEYAILKRMVEMKSRSSIYPR